MALKFKVGDVIRLKYAPEVKIFILETLEQECYAKCKQNWYNGRPFSTNKFGSGWVGKIERYSEIELEGIPKMNSGIAKLVKELKKIRVEKESLIKSQDFEKAAALRPKEQALATELQVKAVEMGVDIKEWLNN